MKRRNVPALSVVVIFLFFIFPRLALADAVIPILDCTARNGDRDYIGYFGYLSEESGNVEEPVGKNNKFTPPPDSRGQPTTFLPGRHNFVFSVQHNGGAVTWHLNKKNDNSSQEWHERCKPICIIKKPVVMDSCSDSVEVNGSLSSTLNNNGNLTSFTWTTNCPGGYFTGADTLTPVLHVPGLDAGNLPGRCSVTLNLVDDTRYGSGNPHEYQTVSCDAPVRFKGCTEDCTGTPDGSAVVDQCGVCNGDNSTCKDCNGVPNGGAVVDECGVCGGHNQSCTDCAGVPNGGHIEDACGVCGGNNQSCADCAGVPNGGQVEDVCGVCGGDGSSCIGGCPPGQSEDPCGVCGGDGSSCNGGCPTGEKPDPCGICGGDGSTCLDCAGIPGGETPVNDCGECGDRISECGICETVEIGDGGQKVLAGFRHFTDVIKKYAGSLAKCKGGGGDAGAAALKKLRVLRALVVKLIQDEFPPKAELCSGDLCELVSGSKVKAALKRLARKLITLLDKLQDANRACYGTPPWKGGASSTWQNYRDLISEIDALPDTLPQCKAGE